MNRRLLLRLVLDAAATAALFAALAYYWLDNRAHELIGTGMFLLLVVHGVVHRRWYGKIREKRDGVGRANVALTLLLLVAMLVLLATSLMISRTLFSFLSVEDAVTARRVHMVAAQWVVLLVSIHLGLRWTIVMGALRKSLRLTEANPVRTVVLRVLAAAIGLHGVQASFDMLFGSKLLLLPVLDMWDFSESTPRFFLNYLSIVGLYASLIHYGSQWMQRRRRGGVARRATSSAT